MHCHCCWKDKIKSYFAWLLFVVSTILVISAGMKTFWWGYDIAYLADAAIIALGYFVWYRWK